MTRHEVVVHAPADDDRADIECTDESRENQMSDVGAEDQCQRERQACEADLTDGNQRPAGIAGRHPCNVANDAAANENLDVGAGMEHDRIGSGDSDQARKRPGADQCDQFPALQGSDVVRIMVDAMIEACGHGARDADQQKASGDEREHDIAAEQAGNGRNGCCRRSGHEQRLRRARRAIQCADEFEMQHRVGDRTIQAVHEARYGGRKPHQRSWSGRYAPVITALFVEFVKE